MPYYLAPYIGSGSSLDPFRPRGSDQPGWSAIDLRPDGGATLAGGGLNACFLALPVADPDPQLMLIANAPADTLGATLKQALVSRLHLLTTPVSTRWDDLAMELLLGPPPGGWKALRPTVERLYDVWLGGLLKRLPVVSGGASISENWNCADSASLTCQLTWTEFAGNATWGITGNRAELQALSLDAEEARAETDLATSDHFAQATIAAMTFVSGGFLAAGTLCRKDSTATRTHYFFRADGTASIARGYLAKIVSGTETQLGADGAAPAVGDVLRVEANGSSITGKVNGTANVGPITDTAITGNLRCGIHGFLNGASDVVALDDWSAADLATPRASLVMIGSVAAWWPG